MFKRKYGEGLMLKAIIFDLDDTLISEMEYIKSGYCHVSKLLCEELRFVKEDLYQLLLRLFAENPKHVFNRLYDSLKIPYSNDKIQQLVWEYRNHTPAIEYYPDVLPCLELLTKRSIKTGIITDGNVTTQVNKLKAVGAWDCFDEIIITDLLGEKFRKPHPKPFELMREKMGIRFDEMMYVGDNPEKDFFISSIYPIITVRINRQGIYQYKNYFNDIREIYSIKSLLEMFCYIDVL